MSEELKNKLIIIFAGILIISWFFAFAISIIKFDEKQNQLKEKAKKYDEVSNTVEVKDE